MWLERISPIRLATIKKFNLPIAPDKARKIGENENVCFMNEQYETIDLGFDTVIGNVDMIFIQEHAQYPYLYLPKALTNDFLQKLIDNRNTYHFDIILDSPINIQLNDQNLQNLFKLRNKLYVINQVNLVAVCMNPISPRGYGFDTMKFK